MEIWKDILGYEGLYQISNLGRVKGLYREWKTSFRVITHANETIKKIRINRHGYAYVHLSKHSIKKHFSIHRLVAEAFIGIRPHDKYGVNHKDGNRLNNEVTNLEWATAKENVRHSIDVLGKQRQRGIDNPYSRMVLQISFDGFVQNVFNSKSQAAFETGISKSHISACSNGYKKSAGGFIWR